MFTGLIMTFLFLSTLAAKTQDVDQEEGVHRLHSYKKKFLNFLQQQFRFLTLMVLQFNTIMACIS